MVATLLHVGMLGVNSREEDVRIAANELLQAVCTYLDFEGKPLVASKSTFRSFGAQRAAADDTQRVS